MTPDLRIMAARDILTEIPLSTKDDPATSGELQAYRDKLVRIVLTLEQEKIALAHLIREARKREQAAADKARQGGGLF